jgi:uncharacterized protein YdbL (DUF1318 family)
MDSKKRIAVCLLLGTLIALVGAAWGQDIKARMHDRLPAIVALKAAGVVGENNQGYLTILKQPTDKKALVDAENQDRRMIYEAIAKQQKTTPELVGQRRAMQIAEKSDPGAMIQDAKGNWIRK